MEEKAIGGDSVNIVILIEGQTEVQFIEQHVKHFLENRIRGHMPRIRTVKCGGPLPKQYELKKAVERLLSNQKKPVDAVVALTDVYTGITPHPFQDGEDARRKMNEWTGNNPNFHPHAAQYEIEAWLIPYRDRIQKISGCQDPPPGRSPEEIDHDNPPSHLLERVFKKGGSQYKKTLHPVRILDNQDLMKSVKECPHLKNFLNTLLTLSSADPIP